jgi:hypothetical protein
MERDVPSHLIVERLVKALSVVENAKCLLADKSCSSYILVEVFVPGSCCRELIEPEV